MGGILPFETCRIYNSQVDALPPPAPNPDSKTRLNTIAASSIHQAATMTSKPKNRTYHLLDGSHSSGCNETQQAPRKRKTDDNSSSSSESTRPSKRQKISTSNEVGFLRAIDIIKEIKIASSSSSSPRLTGTGVANSSFYQTDFIRMHLVYEVERIVGEYKKLKKQGGLTEEKLKEIVVRLLSICKCIDARRASSNSSTSQLDLKLPLILSTLKQCRNKLYKINFPPDKINNYQSIKAMLEKSPKFSLDILIYLYSEIFISKFKPVLLGLEQNNLDVLKKLSLNFLSSWKSSRSEIGETEFDVIWEQDLQKIENFINQCGTTVYLLKNLLAQAQHFPNLPER